MSLITRSLIFLLAWAWLGPSMAQELGLPAPPHSTYGKVHTPRGDLHVLVILVRYPERSLLHNSKWPDSSEQGDLPTIFQGKNNQMFCRDADSLGLRRYQNLSDYLYVMSDGQFRVTAEVYPRQVPVNYVPERGGNFVSRQQTMNQQAVEWIVAQDPEFDWARFDRRTNAPHYRSDNADSGPDGKLDYVLFMHRDHGANGFSSACNIAIPGTDLRIVDGHTGNKNYVSPGHNWLTFLHELAHNLYSAPHYGGANHADGNRYYTQNGWGLMSPWIAPFSTPLAWESWWLGWLQPQTITAPGRYRLGDLVTEHDALRIQVPGTEQYLWLENHQKIDPWDQKRFYAEEDSPFTATAAGVYAYVVAEPGSRRDAPNLGPFNKSHVNMIRWYNGEGNFDYVVQPERPDHRRGQRFPTFEKVASNPLMGQNDFQFIRGDFDGDGKISVSFRHGNLDGTPQEDEEVWNEWRDGRPVHTGNTTGDAQDALLAGDELSLSGKFPVLNYPTYRRKQQRLHPLQLNGLHIRVLPQLPDGSYEVEVRFDDWTVRQDQRWCGPLRLSGSTGTGALTVASGAQLTLDLGGTPDRLTPDTLTGTFTNPTELIVEDDRSLHLQRGAEVVLQRHSRLHLTDQAELRLEPGATLRLEPGTRLELSEQSRLHLSWGARLIVEEGATLIFADERTQRSGWGRIRD